MPEYLRTQAPEYLEDQNRVAKQLQKAIQNGEVLPHHSPAGSILSIVGVNAPRSAHPDETIKALLTVREAEYLD